MSGWLAEEQFQEIGTRVEIRVGEEAGYAACILDLGFGQDGDAIADDVDNCMLVENASQSDFDLDGYGDACDGDLDNNGTVGLEDLALVLSALLSQEPIGDLDRNGSVGLEDLGAMLNWLGGSGPSGTSLNGIRFI